MKSKRTVLLHITQNDVESWSVWCGEVEVVRWVGRRESAMEDGERIVHAIDPEASIEWVNE